MAKKMGKKRKPGRPPDRSDGPRKGRISFDMTRAQQKALREAAKAEGVSVSAMIRSRVFGEMPTRKVGTDASR